MTCSFATWKYACLRKNDVTHSSSIGRAYNNVIILFITGIKDLDAQLGPYPFESLKIWYSLTNHITETLMKRYVAVTIVTFDSKGWVRLVARALATCVIIVVSYSVTVL